MKRTMQCVLLHSVLQVVKEYFELLRIHRVIFCDIFIHFFTSSYFFHVLQIDGLRRQIEFPALLLSPSLSLPTSHCLCTCVYYFLMFNNCNACTCTRASIQLLHIVQVGHGIMVSEHVHADDEHCTLEGASCL